MRRHFPINAVRAFEAAARYESLVRAADELCVTPTAVSHQIRILEDYLQVKLFIRKNGRLELTRDSRRALEKLTMAFDLIDQALASLMNADETFPRLLVGASASVTSLWLMPRMREFTKIAPDIDVIVTSFFQRHEIESHDTDLWIASWRTEVDLRVEPLMEEETIPVCAPSLVEAYSRDPGRLLGEIPLIHVNRGAVEENAPYPSWARYLEEYGIRRADVNQGLRFNGARSSIDAARAGRGALLGRSILIEDLLARGELVRIAEPYPVRSPYFLVTPWAPAKPQIVDRFRTWLFNQGNQHRSVAEAVPA